jgi:hypothetical protein
MVQIKLSVGLFGFAGSAVSSGAQCSAAAFAFAGWFRLISTFDRQRGSRCDAVMPFECGGQSLYR